MSNPSLDRRRILRSLVELDGPLVTVLRDLSGLPWDSDAELVTLRPVHLVDILDRFKSGALSAEDVEGWANAIEAREDIRLEAENRGTLKEAIYDLANPTLQGSLTTEVAQRWLERLSDLNRV
jgi:hypothetical protein